MTAYLRNDLWVKTCIHLAESRATSAQPSTRLHARFTFAVGVAVGVISAAIHALAMLILLIPYVAASSIQRYADLDCCHKIRQLYTVSSGRFQGASVATAVAFVSLFALGFSRQARTYFNTRIERQWATYKQRNRDNFQQRRVYVTASKMAAAVPNEIYRPRGQNGAAYFVILTEASHARVDRFITARAFDLGSVVDEKYERYEFAALEISRFVKREARTLWQLPLTFPEIGAWRVREAKQLKSDTLAFLDEEAAAERERRCATHARKFDHKAYCKGIAQFRAKVSSDLERRITTLKRQQVETTNQWHQRVVVHRRQQRRLQAQAASAHWWLTHFTPVLPTFLYSYLDRRETQANTQLDAVNATRMAGVTAVADGIFLSLNSTFFNLEHTINGLVAPGGKIQSTVEYLARPALGRRVWRWIRPLFGWSSSLQQKMEECFDPDVT